MQHALIDDPHEMVILIENLRLRKARSVEFLVTFPVVPATITVRWYAKLD